MAPVIHTEHSRADYEGIWNYLAQFNANAANRLIASLDERVALLATMPLSGRDESRYLPNLRSLAAGKYLLYYRPMASGIELVRILHSSRDIDDGEYFDETDPSL